jgi:hypothetical protein
MIKALCRLAVFTVVFSGFLGCHDDPTVWRKDFRSPDGAWLATARTKQWGGFGSALVETTAWGREYYGVARRPRDSATLPRGLSIVQICVPCEVMHEAMS